MAKKKSKTSLEDMIKRFDLIWADRSVNAGLVMLNDWPGICKEHGWTSESFDEEMDKWQRERWEKKWEELEKKAI